MAYKELRTALLDKLNISPQALNKQCHKLIAILPMTIEDATYVIAHRNGIRLDKYVDEENVGKIREFILKLTTTSSGVPKRAGSDAAVKNIKPRVVRIGSDIEYTDEILPQKKLKEASEMAQVFPKLYVLENSIREFIKLCMTNLYGADWWDTQAPRELRDDVSQKMGRDKKDSWHQRRGSHPVDYLDMIDLPRLVSKIQQFIVPNIIPNYEWFKQLVEEVYKSRCVVCHMNPLEENNIKSVEVKFNQWQKQINEKKDMISGLTQQP